MTTINVDHMLLLAARQAGSSFRHTLPELGTNLRELRDRSLAGPSEAVKACEEFFALYVFSDAPAATPAHAWTCQRCESVNADRLSTCAGCGKSRTTEFLGAM